MEQENHAFINGEKVSTNDGYISVNRIWKDGDVIELTLDNGSMDADRINYLQKS